MLLPTCDHLEAYAPAKINLHLEILAKSSDGFHELETLMAPVSICDTLRFTPHAAPTLSVGTRWSKGLQIALGEDLGELPAMEQNLAFRALALLRDAAGYHGGGVLEIIKHIPAQAGLGGASSDAASTLLLANRGWRLNWPLERLSALAAELGSDVPFFLHHRPAICRGRGEHITPLNALPPLSIVIVRPPVGLSTPQVYRGCHIPAQPVQVEPLVSAWRTGCTTTLAQSMLNRLEAPAAVLSSWIVRIRKVFSACDVPGSLMSGSGSSCFAICRSPLQARRLAWRLRSQKIGWVVAGRTMHKNLPRILVS
jgi:4-diphosphocytidyl-2-C-methyl-D-erythritol kinase